jgi:recombination protein RecA
MSFMKKYLKTLEKNDDVVIGLKPPSYYLDTGNYALNMLMSGRIEGGSAQGRVIGLAGHSSSGKSLVAGSFAAQVVRDGGMALVIDSEGSLDENFMANLGVDVESENYERVGVTTIPTAAQVVNGFVKMYRENSIDQRALIVVDSLDNPMTESEEEALNSKLTLGGDQGQHAKQLKRMGRPWGNSITNLPITIVCTKQVYKNQDPVTYKGQPWIVTDAMQYICSQIILFEKLNFKDKSTNQHMGFTLKASSFKNRIAREKNNVKIEIPYDHGIEPYSGLLDLAQSFDVVQKNGGWYTMGDKKFQEKAARNDKELMQSIIEAIAVANEEVDPETGRPKVRKLDVDMDGMVTELDNPTEVKKTRKQKLIEAREHKVGLDDEDDEDLTG